MDIIGTPTLIGVEIEEVPGHPIENILTGRLQASFRFLRYLHDFCFDKSIFIYILFRRNRNRSRDRYNDRDRHRNDDHRGRRSEDRDHQQRRDKSSTKEENLKHNDDKEKRDLVEPRTEKESNFNKSKELLSSEETEENAVEPDLSSDILQVKLQEFQRKLHNCRSWRELRNSGLSFDDYIVKRRNMENESSAPTYG